MEKLIKIHLNTKSSRMISITPLEVSGAAVRRCSSKAPLLESLFDKVAHIQASNFIKKRPQYRFFFCEIC